MPHILISLHGLCTDIHVLEINKKPTPIEEQKVGLDLVQFLFAIKAPQ